MDEELTEGYKEPCAQCSAVDWGISDECHFFCRSCHNIIERTHEVVDPTFTQGTTRITTLGKGSKRKSSDEGGWDWVICEAFQFLLMKQADALLSLGVRQEFKDKVLCELWRLYLQKSDLAYTNTPKKISETKVTCAESDSESAAESSMMSTSDTDEESVALSKESGTESHGRSSSVDRHSQTNSGQSYCTLKMRMTLVLIHIGLTWMREPLTLSDLLRLVYEGHVPYINAHEMLPEEMKLKGHNILYFRLERIPTYKKVHAEAQMTLQLLQLPAFPPISRQCLLHPVLLSMRYLSEINLPDDLHPWLCRLLDGSDLEDQKFHTYCPKSCPVLPKYDLQAAALIIVTLKVFIGLDDQTEWNLARQVSDRSDPDEVFNLFRWYKLLQASLIRAQEKRDEDKARKQWKSKKPLYTQKLEEWRIFKKRRVAEQLQLCFEKFSSRPTVSKPAPPSSFKFRWGDDEGADGPSMHHLKLTGMWPLTEYQLRHFSLKYWYLVLRPSAPLKRRKKFSIYQEVEPKLPRVFVWILQLFSFLLDVTLEDLYQELLSVERRVFNRRESRKRSDNVRKLAFYKGQSKFRKQKKSRRKSRSRSKSRPEAQGPTTQNE